MHLQNFFRILATATILLIHSLALEASPKLVLENKEYNNQDIQSYLEQADAKVEDLIQDWLVIGPLPRENQFKPYTTQNGTKSFWLKLNIDNRQEKNRPVHLEMIGSGTPLIKVFTKNQGVLTDITKQTIEDQHIKPTVSLLLKPGLNTFYIRVFSFFNTIKIYTNKAQLAEKNRTDLIAYTVLFAAMATIIIYNLAVFIMGRQKIYALYLCYLIPFFLAYFVAELPVYNYIGEPFENIFVYYTAAITIPLYTVGIYIFTMHFLELKLRLPRLHKVLIGLSAYTALTIPVFCFIDFQFGFWVMFVPFTLLGYLFLFGISIKAALMGYRPALYYLAGFGSLQAGIWIGTLGKDVLIHTMGAVIEMIVFTLAIASKTRMEILELNDELREQEKLRTQFFHNTSHELRTPLNGILGFTELLEQGHYKNNPEEQFDKITKISILAEGLKSQVNTILDLAKSKSQQLEIRPSQFKLSELFHEATLLGEGLSAGKADREFVAKKSWSDNNSPSFVNDYEKILTIIRNLLSNAIKFSATDRKNLVSLDISLVDSNLVIRVSDQGIGIPAERLGNIFDEFRQIDGSTSRAYEGTGLGLTLTKSFVTLMAGEVSVVSELTTGSTFEVKIPEQENVNAVARLTKVGPTQAALKAKQIAQKSKLSSSSHNRILVVDDIPTNCEVMQAILESAGYPTEVAYGGAQALKMIGEKKPDIIILDLMMPEVSGEDVIQHCKNDGNLKDIPIILVTARASQEDRLDMLNMGADEYLSKPIIGHELIIRVRNTLSRLDLVQEKIEKSEIKGQLLAAKKVQQALIPNSETVLPGFVVEDFFQPAEETGGDWYQYFHDERNNRIYIFIADVTGHGVSSSILTGLIYGSINTLLRELINVSSPLSMENILKKMTEGIDATISKIADSAGRSMTALFTGIDLTTGEGVVFNSGHPHILLVDGETVKPVISNGLPLGYGRSHELQPEFFNIAEGESLFLYTDGLTENRGPDDETLRYNQLKKVLLGNRDGEVREELLKKCKLVWKDRKSEDDCTFLIITRVEPFAVKKEA